MIFYQRHDHRHQHILWAIGAALLAIAACSPPSERTDSSTTMASTTAVDGGETSTTTAQPKPVPDPGPSTSATPTTLAEDRTVPIRLRLDRRVNDAETEGFESFVETVLTDSRGWTQAGFSFTFDDDQADYTVVLAEGPEVDELCLPYKTGGRFSCQIGPVVALNADRWRIAVESWPASLADYRTMLVNHEVGHLLGQHHPETRCPDNGQPAPVMAQQSSGVAPCTTNPWPLPWEIQCARMGVEPLAPPFEQSITLTCGPEGSVEGNE